MGGYVPFKRKRIFGQEHGMSDLIKIERKLEDIGGLPREHVLRRGLDALAEEADLGGFELAALLIRAAKLSVEDDSERRIFN